MSNLYEDSKLISLSSQDGYLLNDTKKSNIYFQTNGILWQDPQIAYSEISIHSAEIPNSFYIINPTNNVLNYEIAGTQYLITINPGVYNAFSFITELQNEFNSNTQTWTITYNPVTGKLTFGYSQNFTFLGTSTCNYIIGFENDVTTSSSTSYTPPPVFIPPPNTIPSFCVVSLDAINYSGSGAWVDSVSGLQFTLFNNPVWVNQGDFISGGAYFTFTASQQQYAQANALPLLPNWSLEAWIYYTGNSTPGSCIVCDGALTSPNFNYALGSLGGDVNDLNCGFQSSGTIYDFQNPYTLQPNTWNHCVATYDGNYLSLYVNGSIAQLQQTTAACIAGGSNIFLMACPLGGNRGSFWDGNLAIINIYNVCLNQPEVLANYNYNLSRFPNSSNSNSNVPTSLTMPYPLDVLGVKKIKIISSLLPTSNIDSSLGSVLGIIPVSVASKQMIRYENYNNHKNILHATHIDGIDIGLVDDFGDYLDFNNIDWSMTLRLSIYRYLSVNTFGDILARKKNLNSD